MKPYIKFLPIAGIALIATGILVFDRVYPTPSSQPENQHTQNASKLLNLPSPDGDVILDITGQISVLNFGNTASFDLDLLSSLPQTTISTTTPWTEGTIDFTGPLISDVLEGLGASGSRLKATALNNYFIEIPTEDVKKYPVIFAIKKNGKFMSIRNRGPIWVIYPWSDFPELRRESFISRSIWQLRSITVE